MIPRLTYFWVQPSVIFCRMCSPICLLYLVIHDFVQKALFPKIQVIRCGWGNNVC